MPPCQGSRAPLAGRDFDFTPYHDLGLQMWLRPEGGYTEDDALTTPATDADDAVGGWLDSSKNAWHMVQATAANRPLLKLNAQNGLSALEFDGTNDFLVTAATKTWTYGRGAIFMSVKPTNFTNVAQLLTKRNGSNLGSPWDWFLLSAGGGSRRFFGSAATTSRSDLTAGAWAVVGVTWWGSGVEHRTNGVPSIFSQAQASADASVVITLGARSAAQNPYIGQVGEVCLSNSVADMRLTENYSRYFKRRWGTP